MRVKYICRHCRMSVGEIQGEDIDEGRLGFHALTAWERDDIITYHEDGHVTVNVICDYCAEALETHPELLLITNPLQ